MANLTTQTNLRTLFPTLRSEADVLAEIHKTPALAAEFTNWPEAYQREFLDFCSGVRGAKLLYDVFFKEILNPETVPERLEEFLSLLLHEEVRILAVLPNDSTRIADESTLLITDIVVELKSHKIVNLEIQKIGYKFPGERCACYSADLLLRQYKRVRSEKKKKFSYKDIRTVYTIVLFEHSPQEFHAYPCDYLHYFQQESDTGLRIELLQKYLLIPLDIFHEIQHNKDITNKLDAWLVFLSEDDPEMVERLIKAYPEFKPLYEQVYSHCRNIEEVLRMFSEELRELDRNTVQLMIDEMQEELEEARRERDKAQAAVAQEQAKAREAVAQEQAKAREAVGQERDKAQKLAAVERQQHEKERKHLEDRIKQLEKQLQEK